MATRTRTRRDCTAGSDEAAAQARAAGPAPGLRAHRPDDDAGSGDCQGVRVLPGVDLAGGDGNHLSVIAPDPSLAKSVEGGPQQLVQVGSLRRPCLARLGCAGRLGHCECHNDLERAVEQRRFAEVGGGALDCLPPRLDRLGRLNHDAAPQMALAALWRGSADDDDLRGVGTGWGCRHDRQFLSVGVFCARSRRR